MTILLYLRRKEWPITGITVESTRSLVPNPDAGIGTPPGRPQIDRFHSRITVDGEFTEEQRTRIEYIAGRCPIHRTLESGPMLDEEVELAEGRRKPVP